MTFRTIEEQSLKTPTLMDISEVIFKENAVCYSVECKNVSGVFKLLISLLTVLFIN